MTVTEADTKEYGIQHIQYMHAKQTAFHLEQGFLKVFFLNLVYQFTKINKLVFLIIKIIPYSVFDTSIYKGYRSYKTLRTQWVQNHEVPLCIHFFYPFNICLRQKFKSIFFTFKRNNRLQLFQYFYSQSQELQNMGYL